MREANTNFTGLINTGLIYWVNKYRFIGRLNLPVLESGSWIGDEKNFVSEGEKACKRINNPTAVGYVKRKDKWNK